MNATTRTLIIKLATLSVAAGLAFSTTGCSSMKHSTSAVRSDFEATGGNLGGPKAVPQGDAVGAPAPETASVRGMEAAESVRLASRVPGVVVDEDDGDGRIADNSPSTPPPPQLKSTTAVSLPSKGGGGGAASGLALGTAQVKKGPNAGPPPPPLPPPQPGSPTASGPKGPPPAETPNKQQLLVYTANLQMAVYLVEPGLVAVEKIAKDFGGYLSSRGDNKIEIRVPRERFNEALKAVEATGDVLHRDVQASDVTDQYVDMESRLRNAKVIRARLQALLERAQVKEALEIERELGRVSQEIEVLEGKLKLLRDKVAFSTITVQYAPKAQALQKTAFALPFPWLSQLGLPNLLRLRDHKGDD